MVAIILVFANIFFSWLNGPIKKHVLKWKNKVDSGQEMLACMYSHGDWSQHSELKPRAPLTNTWNHCVPVEVWVSSLHKKIYDIKIKSDSKDLVTITPSTIVGQHFLYKMHISIMWSIFVLRFIKISPSI
jgi:hypothetical protein